MTEQTDRDLPTRGGTVLAPTARAVAGAALDAPAPAAALRALSLTLERVSAELLAMVPYAGDHQTGHEINTYIDELVGSLRSLSAETDDLHRTVLIAERRTDEVR